MTENKKERVFKEVVTKIEDLQIGESVEGMYLDLEDEVGENKSSVLHIRPEGEEPRSIWANDVLVSKLNLVSIGDYIKVERIEDTLNRLKTKSYKTYKVFKA